MRAAANPSSSHTLRKKHSTLYFLRRVSSFRGPLDRQGRGEREAEFVQGKVCACLVDGRPTLKRVSVEEQATGRLVILRGDNPQVPPMIIDETREFTVQGVAVCLVSREL